MPIVIGGVTVAIITSLKDQAGVTNRITDSSDAQIFSASYARDVQSALCITTDVSAAASTASPPSACGTAAPTVCPSGASGSSSSLFLLGLELTTVPAVVSYWEVTTPTGQSPTAYTYHLVRSYCSNSTTPSSTEVLSLDLSPPCTQESPPCAQPSAYYTQPATIACSYTQAATCASPPLYTSQWVSSAGIANIRIDALEPGSDFQYSLSAVPRRWLSASGGFQSIPPFIMLGSCSQNITQSNGTLVIDGVANLNCDGFNQSGGTFSATGGVDSTHSTDASAWAVGNNCSMEVTTNGGTTWSPVSLSGCSGNLNAIGMVDATDGWAVGSNGQIFVCTEGASCALSSSWWLITGVATNNLNAVTVHEVSTTTFDVWAVGANGTVVYCTTSCMAASAFKAIQPSSLSGYTLYGVSTVDGGEAWASGYNGTTGAVFNCTSTALCDSTSGAGSWAQDTVCPSGGCSMSNPPLTLTGDQMNAVSAQATNFVYSVGSGGTVLLCTSSCNGTNASFSVVSGTGASSSTNVTGVYPEGNSSVFLAGSSGFIDVCTNRCNQTSGGTWTTSTPTTQNLTAIKGSSSTQVWAVGANSAIVSNSTGTFAPEMSAITSTTLNGVGVVAPSGGVTCGGSCSPSPSSWTTAGYVSDPLAGVLTDPSEPSNVVTTCPSMNNGSVTLSPGEYNCAMSINGANVTMQSGLYVLDQGLTMSSGSLNGTNGVLLYLPCKTDDNNNPVDSWAPPGCSEKFDQSNGTVTINPLGGTAPDADIWLWQNKGDTSQVTLDGPSQVSVIAGTLYAPGAPVSITGGAGNFDVGRIIATYITMSNGTIDVCSTGSGC